MVKGAGWFGAVLVIVLATGYFIQWVSLILFPIGDWETGWSKCVRALPPWAVFFLFILAVRQ